MSAPTDLTGRTFGRLLVKGRAGSVEQSGRNRAVWLCQCTCGQVRKIPTNALQTGATRSCGCLRSEAAKARWAAARNGAMATRYEAALALDAIFRDPLAVLDKWRRVAR